MRLCPCLCLCVYVCVYVCVFVCVCERTRRHTPALLSSRLFSEHGLLLSKLNLAGGSSFVDRPFKALKLVGAATDKPR